VETDVSSTSNQILDLAAQRRQEKQVVDVEVERTLLVVFHLDRVSSEEEAALIQDEGPYGLPASAVESIVTVDEITYVPGTPPWILGVVNVRGEIESVLDLKTVLGLGGAELTPESRLLIAQDGELRSGLLVDRMIDIVDVASTAISLPPTPLEGGKGIYIAGETEYESQTLVILNLSEIFRRALETDQV
jgi:purine-binding chemotaxis protein CheW